MTATLPFHLDLRAQTVQLAGVLVAAFKNIFHKDARAVAERRHRHDRRLRVRREAGTASRTWRTGFKRSGARIRSSSPDCITRQPVSLKCGEHRQKMAGVHLFQQDRAALTAAAAMYVAATMRSGMTGGFAARKRGTPSTIAQPRPRRRCARRTGSGTGPDRRSPAPRRVRDDGCAVSRGGGEKQILRCADARKSQRDEIRPESLRRGTEGSRALADLHAELRARRCRSIGRGPISHPPGTRGSLARPRQNRAEKYNRRAHLPHQIVRNIAPDMPSARMRSVLPSGARSGSRAGAECALKRRRRRAPDSCAAPFPRHDGLPQEAAACCFFAPCTRSFTLNGRLPPRQNRFRRSQAPAPGRSIQILMDAIRTPRSI